MKQCHLTNYLQPRRHHLEGNEYPLHKWRKLVLRRYNHRCGSCLGLIQDTIRNRKPKLEAHHIIPRHHGGRNTLNNGVCLCTFCHDWFDYHYFARHQTYHELCHQYNIAERIDKVKWFLKRRNLNALRREIIHGNQP